MKQDKRRSVINLGGQALIEGVMMRGPEKTAMAVREPDGEISVEYVEDRRGSRRRWMKLPLIRGVVNFIDSLTVGYKALSRSIDLSGMADDSDNGDKKDGTGGKGMAALTVTASVLGVVLAVFLFLYLPSFLFDILQKIISPDITHLKSLIEGIIKILLFVSYVALISGMKDIRRMFKYHGAEHKTIFCVEKGLPLTVENVREMRRFHPRCGSSFLLIMIILGIFINSVILLCFPSLANHRILWVTVKLLMVPFVCSLGYELLKICGKYDNLFTKAVSAPGLWIQRLTTKEPDDEMLEVAIAAVNAVMPNGESDAGAQQ